ncbi:hypothetical protein U1Q18_018924 [Sarracenia purpurea var. burkii]
MGDYRSNSYADGRKQIQSYNGFRPTSNPHDLSSFYASYSSSYAPPPTQKGGVKDLNLKKAKIISGSSWGSISPDLRRKKRVASYKAYSVEGKLKGSMRKSFKWIKDKCTHMIHGWV